MIEEIMSDEAPNFQISFPAEPFIHTLMEAEGVVADWTEQVRNLTAALRNLRREQIDITRGGFLDSQIAEKIRDTILKIIEENTDE